MSPLGFLCSVALVVLASSPLLAQQRRALWTTLRSNVGAFSVEMPGEVLSEEGTFYLDLGMYARTISRASSPDRSIAYTAFHCDRRFGLWNVSDSMLVRIAASSLASDWQGTIVSQRKISVDGLPGMEFSMASGDSVAALTRIYQRGLRLYVLVASSDPSTIGSGDIDRFFRSFRTLPLKQSVWKVRHIPSLGISVELPSEPVEEANPDLFTSFDPKTGQSFAIERRVYSPYSRLTGDERFSVPIIGLDSSIIGSRAEYKQIKVGEYDGVDMEARSDTNGWRHRSRSVIVGWCRYEISTTYFPGDSISNAAATRFCESLTIPPGTPPADLTSSKTRKLLSDLLSTDDARHDSAADALWYVRPDVSELPLLYSAIDSAIAGTRRDMVPELLRALSIVNDSTTVPFIRARTMTLTGNELTNALMTLEVLDPDALVSVLTPLLQDSTWMPPPKGDLIFYLHPRAIERSRPLFPSVLRLLADSSYRDPVLSLTANALDSGVIDASVLQPYRELLLSIGEQISSTSWTWETSMPRKQIARILGRLPSDERSVRLLRQLLATEPEGVTWTRVEATIALLRLNASVEQEALLEIARERDTRMHLYRQLDRIGMIDRFPAAFNNQQAISEGLLREHMFGSVVSGIDTIDCIGSRAITHEGHSGRVYLFRMGLFGSSRREWLLGIGGIQPADGVTVAPSSPYVSTEAVYGGSEPIIDIDTEIERLVEKAKWEIAARKELLEASQKIEP